MLARQQQQLGKKQQRAAPAPVISGIQRLDNILDDQNVQRSIDKAAQQLEEFVAKNRDDQRTVLLGLPAIVVGIAWGAELRSITSREIITRSSCTYKKYIIRYCTSRTYEFTGKLENSGK